MKADREHIFPKPHNEDLLAPVSKDEFECHLEFIEVHECSECGSALAFCRVHQTPMACECGVTL